MRILHINCNYLGTTLHQLMIERLDSFGIENDVFVATYDSTKSVIKPNENVCVSQCFKKWDRLVFDYKQKKIIKAIEKSFDVASYDLIHAYTVFTDGNCARIISEKYGVPFVVAVRNTDVNVFFKKMIHLRSRGIKTLCSAKKVFFLSDSYRKQVIDRYVPTKKTEHILSKSRIIPNGIDDFWFNNINTQRRRICKTSIKLVYAGAVDKNKNIIGTIKAMDYLEKEGIQAQLTVVGKIVNKSVFKKIIQDKRVNYIKPVDKEKLILIYRENDIFVMPSINESFGLVYAEAMTQGLPVIYTAGQGFDGQFPEGVVGYHVRSDSPEDIAEKIKKIINDYEDISSLVAEKAEKFRWELISQEYQKIYSAL